MRLGVLAVGIVSALGLALLESGDWERVEIASESDSRSVAARVLIEAADGGLLLEHPDQRWEIVPPAAVRGRRPLAVRPEPPTPEVLATAVLASLPPGFDHLVTRHYLVCFDTSRAYAQWCASLFERLHDAFSTFWRHAGFETREAEQPLVVVIFADRRRYEEAAADELGAAADRVVGYYNLLTNRVSTFDLTGSDMLADRSGRSASQAGLEVLSSRQASGLVATLVHEATHQMAFNCGLHRRLAAVPLWVSEGVAIFFETPDLGSERGWRGISGVNEPRRQRFVVAARPGWFEAIVRDDAPFRDADGALDAYAGAWAATAFLVRTRREAFVAYLRVMAEKEPLGADDPERRLAEFRAAFGSTPAALEEPIARFVARLK